jgi:hypothetical protein
MAVATAAHGAEMSVEHLRMPPGRSASLVVSGKVNGEATFGWSILLRIEPRDGAKGRVEFTPIPPTSRVRRATVETNDQRGSRGAVRLRQRHPVGLDIHQREDAWPNTGSFTPFDTRQAGSKLLNGAVDDNGNLIPTPTKFSGELAGFPVHASSGAHGVWDVYLTTSVGDSAWEGVSTTLYHGTITIGGGQCQSSSDCDDADQCTVDSCDDGVCRNSRKDGECSSRNRTTNRK